KLISKLVAAPPRAIVVVVVTLVLCLLALFMTGSRAGIIVSLFSMVLAFSVYFRRDLSRRSGFVSLFVGGMGAALVVLQLMGGLLNARLETKGLADEGRFETYKSTLRMIADHPWLGTGQGTFVWAF